MADKEFTQICKEILEIGKSVSQSGLSKDMVQKALDAFDDGKEYLKQIRDEILSSGGGGGNLGRIEKLKGEMKLKLSIATANELYATKTDLATVATSGSYNDLKDKPDLPATPDLSEYLKTADAQTTYAKKTELANLDGYAKTSELPDFSKFAKKADVPDISGLISKTKADELYQPKTTFAAVATSGSYNDLANKPVIPSIPNLSSFLTRNEAQGLFALKTELANSAKPITDIFSDVVMINEGRTNFAFNRLVNLNNQRLCAYAYDRSNTQGLYPILIDLDLRIARAIQPPVYGSYMQVVETSNTYGNDNDISIFVNVRQADNSEKAFMLEDEGLVDIGYEKAHLNPKCSTIFQFANQDFYMTTDHQRNNDCWIWKLNRSQRHWEAVAANGFPTNVRINPGQKIVISRDNYISGPTTNFNYTDQCKYIKNSFAYTLTNISSLDYYYKSNFNEVSSSTYELADEKNAPANSIMFGRRFSITEQQNLLNLSNTRRYLLRDINKGFYYELPFIFEATKKSFTLIDAARVNSEFYVLGKLKDEARGSNYNQEKLVVAKIDTKMLRSYGIGA